MPPLREGTGVQSRSHPRHRAVAERSHSACRKCASNPTPSVSRMTMKKPVVPSRQTSRPAPVLPPAYRGQAKSGVGAEKPARSVPAGTTPAKRPNLPPVYRPNPEQRVLLPRESSSGPPGARPTAATASRIFQPAHGKPPQGRSVPALPGSPNTPPAYRPQSARSVRQTKPSPAGPASAHPTRAAAVQRSQRPAGKAPGSQTGPGSRLTKPGAVAPGPSVIQPAKTKKKAHTTRSGKTQAVVAGLREGSPEEQQAQRRN